MVWSGTSVAPDGTVSHIFGLVSVFGCLFDNSDFVFGQAVQFVDELIELPVLRRDLPVEDRLVLIGLRLRQELRDMDMKGLTSKLIDLSPPDARSSETR